MLKEAVFHINTEEYVYPVSRQTLVFNIRTARNDIREVRLIHWDRNEPEEKEEIILDSKVTDELFEYWECRMNLESVARYRKYFFVLLDIADNTWYLNANGISDRIPNDGFFEYLYVNTTDVMTVPEWSEGAVYYQIFPERFCNGDKSNDPDVVEPWGTLPTRENHMGGDLQGIIDRLDYLRELRVDCIYLNPIFEADFNHKYATTDYYRIDPQFGTNEVFGELVRKCHERNIRVVLDGVFNHTGVHFKQFEDVKANGEQSCYTDWFHFKRIPFEYSSDDYECVGGYQWMPKLNTGNPKVREFIIDVMRFWIKEYNIDGWRLDVADEVDPSVWEEARYQLKAEFPDIVLIGETWGYGGKLLRGNQMDVVMNYMFRDAVRDYFGRETICADQFADRIGHMLALYRTGTNKAMFNLIDSHDTERFLNIADSDREKLKLAAAFQIMFIGAPSIYYGDELAMDGANDPDDRRCMAWDSVKDNDILDWYKKMIDLRQKSTAVKKGSFRFLEADSGKDLIVFERKYGDERVYVILHKGRGEVTTRVADENIVMGPRKVTIIRK